MSKNCERCHKKVYPVEELKCLNKTWHKICFKCTKCDMTLSMKTYKGFNKMPYCAAHIPKPTATTTSDTPELKRLAANTKNQSTAKYREDFEKAKGKCTQLTNEPEMQRLKQNTTITSNAAYRGNLAKKAAMEKQRKIGNEGAKMTKVGKVSKVSKVAKVNNVGEADNVSQLVEEGEVAMKAEVAEVAELAEMAEEAQEAEEIEVAEVDEIDDGAPAPLDPLQRLFDPQALERQHQEYQLKLEKVERQREEQEKLEKQLKQLQLEMIQPIMPLQNSTRQNLRRYCAVYEYEAQDSDEVSFIEGDVVIEIRLVGAGWIFGRVERTGDEGLVPANYVEPL